MVTSAVVGLQIIGQVLLTTAARITEAVNTVPLTTGQVQARALAQAILATIVRQQTIESTGVARQVATTRGTRSHIVEESIVRLRTTAPRAATVPGPEREREWERTIVQLTLATTAVALQSLGRPTIGRTTGRPQLTRDMKPATIEASWNFRIR